ncbi:HyaD/HybD family hydrogenase maturation endopeptidase [Methyloterricola oryzae]|uniref:HyaD/HybD family hydrogenase maturation endopeptidase n=1 Tax=Methyloterricola oryzae TaxID=1495050 RepID=UPI000699DCB7|nr:HyaD/HybD family hydrogenase maturation endopeptidase [Methyloterricola oryzae]
MHTETEKTVLLLGLGNVLMGDDGLGIRVLERILQNYDLPSNLICLDGGVMGLQLLSHMGGITHLLAIDATQTGAPPGTVVSLEGDDVPQCLTQKLSMHQINFQEVLAISQLQGMHPPHLMICGMVPERVEFGMELTDTIQDRLHDLESAVVKALCDWGVTLVSRSKTAES